MPVATCGTRSWGTETSAQTLPAILFGTLITTERRPLMTGRPASSQDGPPQQSSSMLALQPSAELLLISAIIDP